MRVLGSDVHGLALPCKDLERREIYKDDLEVIAREARRKLREHSVREAKGREWF